jgi:hypothetical protein
LDKFVDDSAQIPFIDINLRPNLPGGAHFGVADFIKNAPLRERERRIEKVLVEQTNNIGVETIEASDFVDELLVVWHLLMIFKLVDFVK